MALNFKDNEKTPTGRALLIVLLVLSLVLVATYSREDETGVLHSVQSAVQSMVAPLKFVGASAGAAAEGLGDAVEDFTATEETLNALKEQNAALIELIAQSEEYRLEAERLQALLDLKDAYDIDGVSARVVGRSTDAWNQTVTIDVGSEDGVETGLTVMGAYGVIGQVISTAPSSATVRLITDPQSGAAAMLQATRAEGVVRGSLNGLLYLENVEADVQVAVGDIVLTSGLGGSYTRGLLIGLVVSVDGKQGDSSRRIVVSPNETVSNLEEVIVVFSAKSKGVSSLASQLEGASNSQDSSTQEGGDE
ncbi:MAG: rod shape-determining protein MreC [Eggerthellaceae bacterium]|nr:rod shape-determining protein MreC [Eggerthellaceae bacterium]